MVLDKRGNKEVGMIDRGERDQFRGKCAIALRLSGCRCGRCDPPSTPIAAALAETPRDGHALPDRPPRYPSARQCAASARPAAPAPRAATLLPRRRAWLRIFVVRCSLPCDP